jgi:uncharacterized protein (TIGR02466 family)
LGQQWHEASDVIPMFPTLVWKIRLAAALQSTIADKALALLAEERRALPPLAAGEGWQSERALHQRPALAELVECVGEAAKGVLHFLRIGRETMVITGCWANVLAPGGAHRMHSHPNNFLSGVYYLRLAAGADTINFHDPRPQTGVIRPPVRALTAENTDQVVLQVEAGTLLLFPAYLAHSVDANASAEERVSISFNLMFSAFTEELAPPMW